MFKYSWSKKEANFGPPLKEPIKGGTHISFEIVLKYNGKYVALRRDSIPGHQAPGKGLLYFCHDLIRRGEAVEACVKRIVKAQAGVAIQSYRVVYIDSVIQKKDSQWGFIPHLVAELKSLPKIGMHGNAVTEVVVFTKKNIPPDFAWWTAKEVREFINDAE